MSSILGIWDGHDSGAALMEGNKILFAINEERLSRRKLEIAFPFRSIEACLEYAKTSPGEISEVAISTSDLAKTIARIFPSLREQYYLIRRRKKGPGKITFLKKQFKYKLTEYPPVAPTRWLSRYNVRQKMKRLGFRDFNLHLVDHHYSHASTAAFCSGFERGLVITLDGLGDGLSGSIYTFRDGTLENVSSLSARHSLGIFFEHVTNLMNMRELEDEGKVMALANYAYPVDDVDNPMMGLIQVNGLSIECGSSSLGMYEKLRKLLWHYPSEQFAHMAQRTLEVKIQELVRNAMQSTGLDGLCLAGGVFSNVKVNRLLRMLADVKECFVFPHMGDGGLALGAALVANHRINGSHHVPLHNLFLGPEYSDQEIEEALQKSNLSYQKSAGIVKAVAEIIADGEIVAWFQGRMELGPRALGARSILALPDSEAVKNELNLRLKKRVWYQPFCPSMLEDDAEGILEDYDGMANRFMTMAYMVRENKRDFVRGVINVDGSCRPQILPQDDSLFVRLLKEIKKKTGQGILLNTSLNLHGEALVCSPEDAVSTFVRTGIKYMAMGDFLIVK
ncbi:MAG: carbamoyltransferase C-terminal domain-containing protein [Thermodesulfobacteriota bacterium]|nr:carbamoyltransferase C-terminal domain-containing protein [Thermodesulfobacteriota bacterium]